MRRLNRAERRKGLQQAYRRAHANSSDLPPTSSPPPAESLVSPSSQLLPETDPTRDDMPGGHEKGELRIDIPLAILLALGSFGYQMLGLPNSVLVGVIAWAVCLAIIGRIIFILLPKRLRNRRARLAISVVVPMFAVAFLIRPVIKILETSHEAPTTPQKVTTVDTSDLHISIDYIRTEWQRPYSPRTIFMAYYLLNKKPVLSPVDLFAEINIVNNKTEPLTIESWSVETGPTRDGPWLRLLDLPASPHLTYYVLSPAKNQETNAVFFRGLSDKLAAPLALNQPIKAWLLCECPNGVPCLGWYERFTLRDIQGSDHYEVISLSDYNQSLSQTKVNGVSVETSKAIKRDLTTVPIVRPFPTDAYRLEAKRDGEITRLFQR